MRNKNKRLGVYAGSFDPLTVGHLWMIQEGVNLFDRLIVAIGINPEKRNTFSLEERLSMLRESLKQYRNLSVTEWFLNKYERQARQNLEVSIRKLRELSR